MVVAVDDDVVRAGKLARGSRAGSSSERLASLERAEPLLRARFCSEPSRAGSFQLASRLVSLAKMVNLWNNNEYYMILWIIAYFLVFDDEYITSYNLIYS
jgi:hypothetical protein